MPFDRVRAEQFLRDIHEELTHMGIWHFLMQGTALGAYRDKGFTPSELDIDVGFLMPKKANCIPYVIQAMQNIQCSLLETQNREVNGRCHTVVAHRDGTKADIVGWYDLGDGKLFAVAPNNVNPHYCIVHDKLTILGNPEDTQIKAKCWGIEVDLPCKIEEYLQREYGHDWRTRREDHISRTRVYDYLTPERIALM